MIRGHYFFSPSWKEILPLLLVPTLGVPSNVPMEIKPQVGLLAPGYLTLKQETRFFLQCKVSFYAQWTFSFWRGNQSQGQGTRAPVPIMSNYVVWYMLYCNVQMPFNLQWSHILRNPSCWKCVLYAWCIGNHALPAVPCRVSVLCLCGHVADLELQFTATVHCFTMAFHCTLPASKKKKKRLKSIVRFLLQRYHSCTIFELTCWKLNMRDCFYMP